MIHPPMTAILETMTDESENIEDFTREYLRRVDNNVGVVVSDVSTLKETAGRIDIRLRTVEAHMTGFMSSAKYLETEIDALRGLLSATNASWSADLNNKCGSTLPLHCFEQ